MQQLPTLSTHIHLDQQEGFNSYPAVAVEEPARFHRETQRCELLHAPCSRAFALLA
jgi:hypothetical protein